MAGQTRDAATLDALAAYAAGADDKPLADAVGVARRLAAAARAAAPAVPANPVATPEQAARLADYLAALDRLAVTRERFALDGLAAEVAASTAVTEPQRAVLAKRVADLLADAPDAPDDVAARLGAVRRGGKLLYYYLSPAITQYKQLQTNWCWAACTEVIYKRYTGTELSQSRLAAQFIAKKPNTATCDGAAGGSKACNQPFSPAVALDAYHLLARSYDRILDDAAIAAELKAGRPVLCRIGWPDESGHAVIIYGVSQAAGLGLIDSTCKFDVWDPWNGYRNITAAEMQSFYKARGKWTHTFTTKKP